jgi:hypothetical protein
MIGALTIGIMIVMVIGMVPIIIMATATIITIAGTGMNAGERGFGLISSRSSLVVAGHLLRTLRVSGFFVGCYSGAAEYF